MRINNNMMAMNTHRQLGVATNDGAKSMEKLSSGMRINRAGDDAAGLAISEKMRGQIRGLNQASSNAQDGISLIQTTEGALNETHAILQRMRELAVQSSTDTNTDADRTNLQDEIDQLAGEITRIAETTQFNTMELLDGTFEDKKFHIGANEGQNVTIAVNDMRADALKVGTAGLEGEADVEGLTFKGVIGLDAEGEAETGLKIEFKAAPEATVEEAVEFEIDDSADGTLTITLGRDASTDSVIGNINTTVADLNAALGKYGVTVEGDIAEKLVGKDGMLEAAAEPVKTTKGIDISTQGAADKAITTVNTALETVSKERSKLGAIQNRLEHTIKNLDTSSENLQSSESRIRDVDMAKEMMEQTRQNILQQASTAMLAQANQAPQGVLQLLR